MNELGALKTRRILERPFRPSEILRGVFCKAEKRDKKFSKPFFSTSEIFHEVEFFWFCE